VDESGRLNEAAIERVLATCADYREAIDRLAVDRTVAVLTSAVRDADNGAELEEALRRRFGFEADTISGEREARLTYLGATSDRSHREPLLVVDIGGGSMELVVGTGGQIEFHASIAIGAVRQTERHLHSDPPTVAELRSCAEEVDRLIAEAVPRDLRASVADGVAVAGTPTSFAAMDQRLERYDRRRVEGHRLDLATCERILSEVSALPLEERRRVPGLHPDRAPAIVAGGVILIETMRTFGLRSIEVSEHDLLLGVALDASRG
jgi:exopolyphosphatase/guanosine-5'-triphosphate,3'-diphosphate pyrophosphatase